MRKLVLGALAVLVLGASALAVFIATFDVSDYRSLIEGRLTERLGRDVRLEGAMELELSLWPSFVVDNVEVDNTPWASKPLFASIERAQIQVALPDLLWRHLKITQLRATDVVVNLERRADGRPNWLFPRRIPKTTKEVVALELRNVDVRYFEPGGHPVTLAMASLGAELAADTPLRIRLSGKYQGLPVAMGLRGGTLGALLVGDSPWDVTGGGRVGNMDVRIQGRIAGGLALSRVDMAVDADGTGLEEFRALVGRPLPTVGAYSFEGRITAAPQQVQLQLALTGQGVGLNALLGEEKSGTAGLDRLSVRASGTGTSLRDWVAKSRWRLDVENGEFHWKGIPVKVSRVAAAVEPGGPGDLRVDGSVDGMPFEGGGSTGPLERLLFAPRSSPLTASVSVGGLEARFSGSLFNDVVEGRVNLTAPDLRDVAHLLNKKWPPGGPVRIVANAKLRRGVLTVSRLDAEAGHSRLSGSGEIIAGSPLKVSATIQSGSLRWDELKGIRRATTERRPRDGGRERVIPKIRIADLPPRNIDLDLAVGNLQLLNKSDVVVQLRGRLAMNRNRIQLGPLIVLTPEARTTMNVTLDTGARPTGVALSVDSVGINYGKLLAALDVADKVRGTLDLHLDVTGQGDDLRSVLASAHGTMAIVGDKGRVPRALLELWGGSVLQLLNPISWAEGDTVKINCQVGRFTIDNGIVNSDVLLLDTSRITVAGDLITDLSTEQLDGLFQSRPKRGSLFRIGAPIRIGGTWSNPKAEPTESKWVTIGKLLIGLSNPNSIIVLFGDLGTGEQNPCAALLEEVPAGKEGGEQVAPGRP